MKKQQEIVGGIRMYKKNVALLVLAALLICPGLAAAFGLGEIDIKSALNQPMDAEIELVGFNSAEIDEVKVELADQQMFERVGVPRPYILTRLKFVPAISAGKPVIKVTSTDSIREPFLTFLIDVRWSKGKLLREYTVLLDPPVFGDKAKASIQAPKVATQTAPKAKPAPTTPRTVSKAPRQQQVTSPRAAPKPKARPIAESPPPEPLKKTDQPVSVKRGDTLWSIAEPYARQKGVSVNQMMLAIQAANPAGFGQGNINNLKSGIILRIPADAASRYSDRQALAEVQRQWQAWKQGSQPIKETDSVVNVDAGEVVENKELDTPTPKQDSAGADSSKLSILGEDELADGKSGDDAQATLKELRNQVNLLKENSESKLQENSELKDRIDSLESMIKKQEDIISLQNEQLAQLQNTLTTDSDGMSADPASEQPIAEVVEQPEQPDQSEVAEPQADVAAIKPAQVEPLPDFSGPIPEEFLNAEQAVSEEKPESLIAEAEVKEAEIPAEPIQAEASLLDKVMAIVKEQASNLKYALIALVVGLLGWLGLRRRNAGKNEEAIAASGLPAFEDEPSMDDMLDETVIATPDSVDQALDELDTVEPDESSEQEDISEGESADDVLAEADVYISYGLYQQAEELLKDGLAKEPSNTGYQLKLAEIYHGDKKSDEFVQHVESIESSFDKSSPEWLKIVSMGAALAPAHALFAGTDTASPAEAAAVDDDISEALDVASSDDSSFNMESDDEIENFDSDNLDDNSLDFTFGDDDSDNAADASEESATAVLDSDLDFDADDEIDESSTAILEDSVDLDSGEATQAFTVDDELLGQADKSQDSDGDEVFLDFDQDDLESELNTTHDSETEMLDESIASGVDLDDAINLEDNLETETFDSDSGVKIDNDLDDMLDSDGSETAMFDSSLFDVDSAEADPLDNNRVDEDTVSLEQVQENLTAELETLSFDSEIDPDKIEEDSLPTLQTSEIGKPDLDDMDDNLAASETGTFEADMLADSVTEQFDVEDIDSTMTDFGEFGGDDELENPSVIEEVGTKLDLAKAFVDMGDEDAAKETLTEVIEQGDSTQIQEAKNLLDKLD